MKLIDTDIIMYALGKPHSLKEPCRAILQKVVQGRINANIDVEVLQELLYVYDSRGERRKGLKILKENLILFPNPLTIGKNDIVKATDLMTKHSTLNPRDAIHCTVVINSNLEGNIIDWCYCCFALLNLHLTAAPVRPSRAMVSNAGSGNSATFTANKILLSNNLLLPFVLWRVDDG